MPIYSLTNWFNDVKYLNDFKFKWTNEDGGLFADFDNIWYECPHGSDYECRKYKIGKYLQVSHQCQILTIM